MACVFNKAQSFEYVFQNCFPDDTAVRENSGGFLRMQTYDVGGDAYLSFPPQQRLSGRDPVDLSRRPQRGRLVGFRRHG